MSNAEKKQKNREYYLRNRERILTRAKARKNNKRATHLEILSAFRSEDSIFSAVAPGILKKDELCQPSRAPNLHPVSAPAVPETDCNVSVSESIPAKVRMDSASPEIPPLFEPTQEISPDITEFTQMKRGLELAEDMTCGHDISSKLKAETDNSRKMARLFSKTPISVIMRLILVVGLTLLMTAMQVAFYREHDILPGYAIPLALASEIAFLSLATMKFRPPLEWLRIMVHLIFFGYFVSALSFHVYAKSRSKAASEQMIAVPESTEIRNQLKQAERSLEVATKGRAWKNMEILGAEVSRLRKLTSKLPSTQVLGASSDQTLWMEAILLILLRALLLAASALNALSLRNQFMEMTCRNRPTDPCTAVV